jgi:hypothetical protein
MQLAELRARIAPLFGMTDDNLRLRQQSLYREPALRSEGMTGRGTELRDRAHTATAVTSALLVLTGLLGKTRETIGRAVVEMWLAPPVTKTGNPLERCELAGAALGLLLQRADIRKRLSDVELNHDVPQLLLRFDRGSEVVYAPYAPEEWKRRVEDIKREGKMTRVSHIPVAALDKVAELIEA